MATIKFKSKIREVTESTDAGYAARPKGVRFPTMRHLAQLVATRHGGGFYGPRPYSNRTF